MSIATPEGFRRIPMPPKVREGSCDANLNSAGCAHLCVSTKVTASIRHEHETCRGQDASPIVLLPLSLSALVLCVLVCACILVNDQHGCVASTACRPLIERMSNMGWSSDFDQCAYLTGTQLIFTTKHDASGLHAVGVTTELRAGANASQPLGGWTVPTPSGCVLSDVASDGRCLYRSLAELRNSLWSSDEFAIIQNELLQPSTALLAAWHDPVTTCEEARRLSEAQ
eukprot:1246755-Amphidinium_carterae.1